MPSHDEPASSSGVGGNLKASVLSLLPGKERLDCEKRDNNVLALFDGGLWQTNLKKS
jgi:hypothetical protein